MTRISNIMKRILITSAAIIAAALSVNAQQMDTIKISNITTTHIRFSSEIKYVDLSNKVLAAKIVEGSRDIIALKAKEPFDFITTMSCLEANGAMHTYLVQFEEYPKQLVIETGKSVKSEETATPAAPAIQNRNTTLEDALKQPKSLYHIGSKGYGSKINLELIQEKYQSRLDRVDSDRIRFKEINGPNGALKSIRIEVDYFFWTREYLITPITVNQKDDVDLCSNGNVYDLG